MQLLSVIVPVYNEAGNIRPLLDELIKFLPPEHEIIFLDDGSTDNTFLEIISCATTNKHIKCISLSRNFGHQNALMAGMQYAKGNQIITMDGDLQHPPSLIPLMKLQLDNGFDIIHTKRNKTKNIPFIKKIFTSLFYSFINLISDIRIEPNSSDFRAFNRKVLLGILQFEERELFLRGIFRWVGYNTVTLEFNASDRKSGISKYSFGKMVMLGLKGITSFSYRPLRLALLIGVVISFIALLFGLFSLIAYFKGNTVPGWASLIIAVVFLGGIQLLSIGLIGEYIAGLFTESKKRPLFLVKEEINI